MTKIIIKLPNSKRKRSYEESEEEYEEEEYEEEESEEEESEEEESEEEESEEEESEEEESEETIIKKFNSLTKNKKILNYFKKMYNKEEKKNIIKKIKLIEENEYDKPELFQLLDKDIPSKIKKVIYNKIKLLMNINKDNDEYHKLSKWVISALSIPFNKNNELPVSIKDGYKKCKDYIDNCIIKLDESVYGMNDAKLQFIQLIAKWIMNPNSGGETIALKGPMGTGKTTLLKNGISKILNREFIFIPLGGANDGSYLEGHSYTFQGSIYGKIIDLLIQCKSSNPIIYFDELDKVSETTKGDEIIGILTHITDITQNTEFNDKYFSEFVIDLSKCLFIFSYNDDSKVNKILKDRMYVIETCGYLLEDKVIISEKFIIPKLEIELNQKNIIFTPETIRHIIRKTINEKGIRNLKRSFEIIFNKINLYSILNKEKIKDSKNILNNITFPLKITEEIVDCLIIKKEEESFNHMYI